VAVISPRQPQATRGHRKDRVEVAHSNRTLAQERRKNASKAYYDKRMATLRKPGKTERDDQDAMDRQKASLCEILVPFMADAKALREDNPTVNEEDYLEALRRRVRVLVAKSELQTLHKARSTVDEFREFWADRRKPEVSTGSVKPEASPSPSESSHADVKDVAPPDFSLVEQIDLEAFLANHQFKPRATAGLFWLAKNLQLPWVMEGVLAPQRQAKSALGLEADQAPVAEPIMIFKLGETLQLMMETNDPLMLATLASYLMCYGCMRVAHVLRSFPVRRQHGWVSGFCPKGKQSRLRSGFFWGSPTKTHSGFDWSNKFFELFEARGAEHYMKGAIFRADNFERINEMGIATTMKAALLGGNPAGIPHQLLLAQGMRDRGTDDEVHGD